MDVREKTRAWARIVALAHSTDADLSLTTAAIACLTDLQGDGLGINIITQGRIRTIACATNEDSAYLENAQLVSGEGPCTEAYRRRTVVAADLQLRPQRWPAFTQIAAELGVRSVTAAPLSVGPLRIGAMSMYRTTPTPLNPMELGRLGAYAGIIALLTLDEHAYILAGVTPAATKTGPPGYPPDVYQAAGALAAQHDLSADDALARLRAHAYSTEEPILLIAHRILTGQLVLERDPT
ncbi:MAG TPA: GAF and ANTAR domain-containing protein [Streptomyces sp.]|nr:GAF and ANTAR domain-containing protein [Streptomyces sp.]